MSLHVGKQLGDMAISMFQGRLKTCHAKKARLCPGRIFMWSSVVYQKDQKGARTTSCDYIDITTYSEVWRSC